MAGEVGGATAEGTALLRAARAQVDAMLDLLARLVEVESPTGDEEGNRKVADRFQEALEARGAVVARRSAPGFGDHVVARLPGPPGAASTRPVLILGHMDTVHPRGTLATLPFAVKDDRVTGPGVFDMKGGWACFLAALDLLRAGSSAPAAPLLIIITCDEEVGSPSSRALIEEAGRACGACLVLEPSLPGGAVKLRRKGTGEVRLTVRGRAAHAGIEPEAGVSAVHEMAHQILAVTELGDPEQETHVNVGVLHGGTGANVVAARAEATVDFRFWTRAEAERLEAGFAALQPVDSRCTLEVTGGVNRMALESTPRSEALYARAREHAASLGLELGAGGTGGASDGNLTAAVGCPTLDGLGPEGGGAHSDHEFILREKLPHRIALLALLLEGM